LDESQQRRTNARGRGGSLARACAGRLDGVAVTITIAALALFVQIDVMTQGGPLDSTTTIIFQAVQEGFRQQEVGYGSAISLIFFVLVLGVSLVQRRLTKEKEA
jgi:multiple sugar transport system permease protein